MMKKNNKRVLVTGAAGFIGYHLVKLLIDLNYDVIGVDNLNGYYDSTLKYDRLFECGINNCAVGERSNSSTYKNYKFYLIDITDFHLLKMLFNDNQFDFVINLAGQAGVRYSIENPSEYVSSNIMGFLNVLECCKISGVKNVLYASSSSVYGSCTSYPFREDMHVNNMLSIYAVSKKTNEDMANVYRNLYKMNIVGLRFFSVYGSWGRPDMAMMIFTKSIINNEVIRLFNNGEHKRDFTFVDDVVRSILLIMQSPPTTWESIYNIGNTNPVHIKRVLEILEEKLHKKSICRYEPLQHGDVKDTHADMTLFSNQFGKQQFTSIEKGIDLFLQWYLKYYKISNR